MLSSPGPNGLDMRDLGALGGIESWATGINNAGQVVGYFDVPGRATHAFITGHNGVGMRDLGTFGEVESWASGINDSGQVAGYFYRSEGIHAFITSAEGVGMKDLGTLTFGRDNSWAHGINDEGQVVGWSDTSGGARHAFITAPNGESMADLNSLVYLPRGVILTEAVGVNNLGQVLAVSIVPEPESSALMLVGLGLIGFISRRKKMEARPARRSDPTTVVVESLTGFMKRENRIGVPPE